MSVNATRTTLLASFLAIGPLVAAPDFSLAPGVVISYEESPDFIDILLNNEVYIADPEIVVLPNGWYIASHSYFGSGSTEDTAAITKVFRSTTQGATWNLIGTFQPLWRASLFVFNGALYMVGPTHNGGSYNTLRRSTDNGTTWTSPTTAATGSFEAVPRPGALGTPNSPLVAQGRLFVGGGTRFTVSVPSTAADPLDITQWRISGVVQTFPAWPVGLSGTLDTAFIGESNVVASPELGVAVLGKVEGKPYTAVMRADRGLGDLKFGPSNDFAALPGGEKKFGAAYDAVSGKFYALTNPILPAHAADNSLTPQLKRNTAAVLSSRDLLNWEVEKIFLYSPNLDYEAWQYLQFDYDGDDMVVASRTAFDVGETLPPRGHDSNLLTFHRLPNFRTHTRTHYLQADTAGHQVLRFETNQNPGDPAPLGKFTLGNTFAGAALTSPNGIAQDASGEVYIRESGGRILHFDAMGNFIAVVASSPAPFSSPTKAIVPEAAGERTWIKSGAGNWGEPLNWYYWGRVDTPSEVATFGSAAAAATTVTLDAGPLLWTFNYDADEEGWSTAGVTTPVVTGGAFTGTSSTNSRLDRIALAFPGSLSPEVRIRLRASGPGTTVDFYWGHTGDDTFTAARMLSIPYTGAGAFQDLVIPMAGNAEWDGRTITRLRFVMPKDAGATFGVDEVRVLRDTYRIKGLRWRSAQPYTITGGGSLRLDPDMGAGFLDVQQGHHVMDVPITLGSAGIEITASSGTSLTFTEDMSGPGGFNKTGSGTVTLAAVNAYAGDTTITAGVLRLGIANPIPNSTGKGNVIVSGTLNLNGLSDAINGLSGTGFVETSSGAATLTVGGNNQTSTFSGVIRNSGGTLSLLKNGTGILTLSGANTYTGPTTITAGAISVAADSGLGAAPASATGGKLVLHNGRLLASATMTLHPNRGIALGTPGGSIEVATGATLTYGGVGTGAGSLTKAGAGTLVLSGANAYDGHTLITAGTLAIGAANAIPAGLGKGNATVTGALALNGHDARLNGLSGAGMIDGISGTPMLTVGENDQTSLFSGVIKNTAGSLTLRKTGSGALTLSGQSTYTGGTLIEEGTILLAAIPVAGISGPLGLEAGAVTLAGGATLASHSAGFRTILHPIVVNGDIALGQAAVGTGGLTFSGAFDLGGGTRMLTVNGSTATISGPVANGGIVKDGAGVLSLNSTANSFAGDVTVAAGTLSLGAAHVLPNGPGKGNVIIHGTLALNGRSDIINGLSGTGIIDGISGTPTLTVGDNNQSGIFSGVIRNTAGTLSLAKIGTGTLVLNGANTYTGPTMVSSGTLIVDGNLDSPVTVTGGALAGNGTLARNLTIQAGGTLRVEIDGPGYDRLRLTGTTSAVTLAGALDLLAAPGLAAGSTYTIIDNSGNSTAVSGAFAGLSNNQEFYEDAQWWRITYTGGTGNDVVLTRLAPTAWQSWQATHFGTGANNPALAGDFADPDLDGILNLLEYALGASPLVKGLTVLPTSRIAGGRLALTFTRTLSTIDLTLTVQGADTPAGPWSDLASSTTGAPFTALAGTVAETGSGATRNVEVQDQYLLTDPLHPRRFLRLRVSR